MDLAASKKFLAKYDEYLKTLDNINYSKRPEWYDNRVLGMRAAIMHPDFTTDIATLSKCNRESVLRYYISIRAYLCMDYGFDPEVVESFLLYATSGDMNHMSPIRQVDGISVVDFEKEEMYPSPNPKEVFKAYQEYNKISPHVYLRFGRSVERKDIEWFLEQFWDDLIASQIDTLPPLKFKRVPKTLFRDAAIYAQHKSGLKSSDIVKNILSEFKGTKQIEQSYVYSVVKKLKPAHGYFALINEQIKGYLDNGIEPHLHFEKDEDQLFYLLKN